MRKLGSVKTTLVGLTCALALLAVAPAAAVAAPEWSLEVTAPDRAAPGATFRYGITPSNVGDSATDNTGALDISLPPGFEGVAFEPNPLWVCGDPAGATSIHCEYEPPISLPIEPGKAALLPLLLKVAIAPGTSGERTGQFQVSGGGASNSALATSTVRASAFPEFRITKWEGHIATDDDGRLQAAGHPRDIVTDLQYSTREYEFGDGGLAGQLLPETGQRNLVANLPPGFIGAPSSAPTCEGKDLNPSTYKPTVDYEPGIIPACPIDSIVGYIEGRFTAGGPTRGIFPFSAPIFNMKPTPGEPARFGFKIVDFPVELVAGVRTGEDHGVQLKIIETSQGLPVIGAKVTFWGVPGDSSHNGFRCQFYDQKVGDPNVAGCPGAPGDVAEGPNPSGIGFPKAFLTLPTSCNAPGEGLRFDLAVDGWAEPHQSDAASFAATDQFGNGTTGCDRVPFAPTVDVQPTTDNAETPTGLEVVLNVPPDGLENPRGIAQSHLKDAKVSLPEGMTLNPGYANGVGYCSAAQMGLISGDSRQIRFDAAPVSCPEAATLGEVQVVTPVLTEPIPGRVYVAQQDDPGSSGAENPFNSLLALYVVAEGSGVRIKLAGEVDPDPRTGQIVTTFLNNPQLPFSKFTLKFKGGQRAPLAMPAACGTYTTTAELTPWARPNQPVTATDTFRVSHGPDGGPCLAGNPGSRKFNPGISAGTLNNNAGSYSPFVLRLSRNDGEQEITSLSMDLPPGLSGKLAGLAKCADGALFAAQFKRGAQELANPSCPQSSRIGRVEVGAGVGALPVYVEGKAYLAGPYRGAPLSVAVITPAKTGPFDVGTVVVRSALRIDADDAQVHVDAAGSDPIPTILQGITLHLRDIRVLLDRPEFTLNPTNCNPFAINATLTGTGQDFITSGDDSKATASNRFQAANCSDLPFKPRLSLEMRGQTKRTGNPAVRAVLTMPKDKQANISSVSVVLPKTAFIDQSHISNPCTRVQFNAGACPPKSILGHATAYTPLLDQPLSGPVYFRSNGGERELPDLVADLNGEFHITVVGFIDCQKRKGSEVCPVRTRFQTVPDAPVSRFVMNLAGGKRGLIENSANLCKVKGRASIKMAAQSGATYEAKPLVKVKCGKKGKKGKRGKGGKAKQGQRR